MAEEGDRIGPRYRLLREATTQEVLQVGRSFGRQRWTVFFDDVVHGRHRSEFAVWGPACQQLDDGARERPNVRSGRGTVELYHLRRHCSYKSGMQCRPQSYGDLLQLGVPVTSFLFCIALRLSETPKSDSLMLPFLVVKIFAAFKSQCTTCVMIVS